MKHIFLSFLDWIYKKKCYCCSSSKESVILCSNCYNELDFSSPSVNRIINGVNIYIAGSYCKQLQKIIRGVKYHNKKELAHYLAKYMAEYFETLDIKDNFIIVPVPLHEKRQKKRKYNHMELVADELSIMLDKKVNYNLITRIKDTKPQYKLSRIERMKNLESAFDIDKSQYNGETILLIDDICTTGTTFESIINESQKNGITNIICLAATSPIN